MKEKSFTEYVIMGALMSGSKHGYEIMQFLGSALESTWRLSTSQLYVLIKRLEEEGLLVSYSETQDTRPSKRVLKLTVAGKKTFKDWLRTPVEHVREFRNEFLCKMFFFDYLSLSGADDLVDKQVIVLQSISDGLKINPKKQVNRYKKLVYGFKMQTIECLLTWLDREARPFACKKG